MSGITYKHEDEAKQACRDLENQTGFEFDYLEDDGMYEVFQVEGGCL